MPDPLFKADPDRIRLHLIRLFSRCADEFPGGMFEIRCIHPGDHSVRAQLFDTTPEGFDKGAAWAVEMNEVGGYNTYVGVNPRKPGTFPAAAANAKDVEIAFFQFADIDSEESVKLLKTARPLEYTFAVTTGRVPNPRPHIYWELETPTRNMTAWRGQQEAIADHFKSDRVIDPPRIMRLAGSVNYPSTQKMERGYRTEVVTIRTQYDGEDREPVTSEAMHAAYPPAAAPTKPGASGDGLGLDTGVDAADLISKCKVGDHWYDNHLRLVAHYHGCGLSEEETVRRCRDLTLTGYRSSDTDQDTRKAFASARKRWGSESAAVSVLSVPWLGGPEILPPLLPKATDMPIDMMPASLRPWLEDAAERSQIPLAFIAAPAIVALSSLIGRTVGIHPKRRDDWLVVPNLWGAVIGRPGVLKSPAVAEAFKPLQRLAALAREEFEDQTASMDAQEMVLKVQLDAARDAAKKAAKRNDSDGLAMAQQDLIDLNKDIEQAEVTERRHIINDGTVEKIGELLNHNPRGLLLARDEMSGFLRTLDKPGREGDREFYLEAWNGSGAFTYDRIGRGTLHIPALCLSIFGTIQPGKLQAYISGALKGGAGDDGLLQGLQLIVWPEISPDWVNIDRAPDEDARQQVYQIFQRIDTLSANDVGAVSQSGDIPALRFSPAAQELFDTFRNELELRLRSDEFATAPAFESHLSKYRSLMPSLALIFHLAEVVNESASSDVSIEAARQAARWCVFLEAHARKMYAAELNTDLSAAHAISEKIRSGGIVDGQRVRDIYRPQWSGLTVAERVWSGLRVLENHNHLKIEEGGTEGHPADILRINPSLKCEVA